MIYIHTFHFPLNLEIISPEYKLKAKREGGVRIAVFTQKTVFTSPLLWIHLLQGVSHYTAIIYSNPFACLLIPLTRSSTGLPTRQMCLGP